MRAFTAVLSVACWALAGCGAAATSGAGSANAGTVLERSEGFAERPGWADADQPFSRSGDTVRVVGYVAIDAGQRLEAGYRAADSYARAELIRFLSVRVVAVLQDDLKSGQPGTLSERIEETAQSWTDELIIAQRYHERREHDAREKLHIWSRLDIDQAAVAELLKRATDSSEDLRTKHEQLAQALRARWSEVAEVADMGADTPLVPAGVLTPQWAKAGDDEDDAGFRFVCFGLAEDEAKARALARARCNEKLCRLFGVQITSRTTVTENLDGVSAQSEVSEQCADVRVKGRQTVYQADECGPRGCVQWLMHSYPRSAYEEERKRLDEPTVIRQEVVIQEGDKKYRDPAACEASLRAYGAVEGRTAPAFEERKKQLSRALQVCQDIDTRDSGLFLSMHQLLTTPLPSFTHDFADPNDYGTNMRDAYTYASRQWRASLETMRFLTDRIKAVLRLVDDAILPMRILDLDRHADAAAVEALVREIMKQPFSDKPVSPHHRGSIHNAAFQLVGKNRGPSRAYRDFLLGQVERGAVRCTQDFSSHGRDTIVYFGADDELDDREWSAVIRLLREADERGAGSCVTAAFSQREHRGKRTERIDQVAGMIARGEIPRKDPKQGLAGLISALPDHEGPEVLLRWYDKAPGSEKVGETMVENVMLGAFLRRPSDMDAATHCRLLPDAVRPFFERFPFANASRTALCNCLREQALAPPTRRALTELLVKYASQSCDHIQPADWPGEYYDVARPSYRSMSSQRGLPHRDGALEARIDACHKEHVPLHSASTVTNGTATVQGNRLSKVKLETQIYGSLKQLTRKAGRGLPQASEIHAMNKALSGCIARALDGYALPYDAKAGRIWFQLWDENIGGNGYEN